MGITEEYIKIPCDWLEYNYEDIKEGLGFGRSDDWKNENGEDLTFKQTETLRKEVIKRFKEGGL